MARIWQSTRRQRILLQVAMGLILGATVALAGWVTHERRQIFVSDEAARNVHLSVMLPSGWEIINPGEGNMLVAHAAAVGGGQRILAVLMQNADDATSPREFLIHSDILNGTFVGGENSQGKAPTPARAGHVPIAPIQVAGMPGIVAWVRRPGPATEGGGTSLHNELIACTVLPTHQAIVLRLNFPPEDDTAVNLNLLREVAADIRVGGE